MSAADSNARAIEMLKGTLSWFKQEDMICGRSDFNLIIRIEDTEDTILETINNYTAMAYLTAQEDAAQDSPIWPIFNMAIAMKDHGILLLNIEGCLLDQRSPKQQEQVSKTYPFFKEMQQIIRDIEPAPRSWRIIEDVVLMQMAQAVIKGGNPVQMNLARHFNALNRYLEAEAEKKEPGRTLH